jgi:hypothetical protein
VLPLSNELVTRYAALIVTGESGSGKTTFLRHLADGATAPLVFIRARDCEHSVIDAIAAKLRDAPNTRPLLDSFVQQGVVQVCIDALDEAPPSTQKIVKDFFYANQSARVVLTCQKLNNWVPPRWAQTVALQPLDRPAIPSFLKSRPAPSDLAARIDPQTFAERAEAFVTGWWTDAPVTDDERLAKRVLTNPLDLTLAASLLWRSVTPKPLVLLDEYVQIALEEYENTRGIPFPLKLFADTVYTAKVEDRGWIESGVLRDACEGLRQYKILLFRQMDANSEQWQFRHERLKNYFVATHLINEGTRLIEEHATDRRFRECYVLLSEMLPLASLQDVRNAVTLQAARTRDHEVADAFVQAIDDRWSHHLSGSTVVNV